MKNKYQCKCGWILPGNGAPIVPSKSRTAKNRDSWSFKCLDCGEENFFEVE